MILENIISCSEIRIFLGAPIFEKKLNSNAVYEITGIKIFKTLLQSIKTYNFLEVQ